LCNAVRTNNHYFTNSSELQNVNDYKTHNVNALFSIYPLICCYIHHSKDHADYLAIRCQIFDSLFVETRVTANLSLSRSKLALTYVRSGLFELLYYLLTRRVRNRQTDIRHSPSIKGCDICTMNAWLKARYLSGLSFSSQVNWTEWFIIIISFIIIIRYAGIKHALNN